MSCDHKGKVNALPRLLTRQIIDSSSHNKITPELAEGYLDHPIAYCAYGDDIFPPQSHTIGKYVGNLNTLQLLENRTMSTVPCCQRVGLRCNR
jgi:hypothetical protein